jgi:hypothetical protein
MRVISLAFLLLPSCLAPKAADVGPDAASSACTAAGGACVAPGPECLSVVSLSISCGVDNAICCTVTGTTVATAGDATTVTAPPSVGTAPDATTSTAASSCDTTCEMTCEGDPICIQSCGC